MLTMTGGNGKWWWWRRWGWWSKKGLKNLRGQARSQVLSNKGRSGVAFLVESCFFSTAFFLAMFFVLTLFAFLAFSFLVGANGGLGMIIDHIWASCWWWNWIRSGQDGDNYNWWHWCIGCLDHSMIIIMTDVASPSSTTTAMTLSPILWMDIWLQARVGKWIFRVQGNTHNPCINILMVWWLTLWRWL